MAFSQPEQCEPGTESGGQQWWITFILLALFIAQAAVTCAAALVSLRGEPALARSAHIELRLQRSGHAACRQTAPRIPLPAVRAAGTPLEPSKRRWVTWLSYAFLASLPVNAGLLAWAGWVVEAGDGTCWSSGNKKMAGGC